MDIFTKIVTQAKHYDFLQKLGMDFGQLDESTIFKKTQVLAKIDNIAWYTSIKILYKVSYLVITISPGFYLIWNTNVYLNKHKISLTHN
jgi:hypothetical protein